jgi:hypothetical protein
MTPEDREIWSIACGIAGFGFIALAFWLWIVWDDLRKTWVEKELNNENHPRLGDTQRYRSRRSS